MSGHGTRIRIPAADGQILLLDWLEGDEQRPSLVFLCGFQSNFNGEKAECVVEYARRAGLGCLRFDYRGHGGSGGDFHDYTPEDWLEDALAAISTLGDRPLILVGSSMGAWLAMHAALRLPPRQITGLLTIAAATDFPTRILEPGLGPLERQKLAVQGWFFRPSPYGGARINQSMLAAGRRMKLLEAPIPILCPVRLLHGSADKTAPWQLSADTLAALQSSDARLILIKDGDHRLSDAKSLQLIQSSLDDLLAADRCNGRD
ncbi:MAG: hypothetical protein RL095_3647 [Verrucomicrobiota bacterium]|jgi:pimeloyl-ACP methyl ester carboxylesterase